MDFEVVATGGVGPTYFDWFGGLSSSFYPSSLFVLPWWYEQLLTCEWGAVELTTPETGITLDMW